MKLTLPGTKVGGNPSGAKVGGNPSRAMVGGNPPGATVGGIPTFVFWLWKAKGGGAGAKP